MSKVVNLRQARKRKAREDRKVDADANAARHGMTKSEKAAKQAEDDRAVRLLDGHKREPSP